MSKNFLSKQQIQKLFDAHGLGSVTHVEDCLTGFSNVIQFVNDTYVVKQLGAENDEDNLKQEAYILKAIEDTIPAPKLLVADFSGEVIAKPVLVMTKLKGAGLYSVWQTFEQDKQQVLVKQIAEFLKNINDLDTSDSDLFQKDCIDWYQTKLDEYEKNIAGIEKDKILSPELISKICTLFEQRINIFKDSDIKLTYADLHFDNILIHEGEISGVIDFETVQYMSKDFVLLPIKRLSEFPREYMPDDFTGEVIESAYKDVYGDLRKYYPDVYDFPHIDARIDMYSIIYDLGVLLVFPKAEDRKAQVVKIVDRTKKYFERI